MTATENSQFEQKQTLRCGLTLRNAFVLAPLDLQLSLFDGTVSRNDIWFHQQHTRTVGLDIVGSAYVSACASTANGSISVAKDENIAGLKLLAATIHRQGAKAILQLSHAGELAVVAPGRQTTVAPSATAGSVALNSFEVTEVIAAFGQAAERAYQAGFDGVELQGANRFLLQEFTSPLSNRRTDVFGGSLARRLTVPIRVVQRVQQVAWQADRPFAVGYRLSPEERRPGGLRVIDTLVLARLLEALDIDYLSLSLHQYHQPAMTGYTVAPVVQTFRQQLRKLPLMVAGGIRTEQDLRLLAGEAELVAIGTPMIFNPDWPVHRQLAANQSPALTTPEQLGISPVFVKQLLKSERS